jgi:hypothetical protein
VAYLFQYAVILQEKRDTAQNIVDKAEVIVDPGTLLAKDEGQAKLLVGAMVPADVRDNPDKMDRVVVITGPF